MEFIDPWFLYFWTRLDSVHGLLLNIAFGSLMLAIVTGIIFMTNAFGEWSWIYGYDFPADEEHEQYNKDYIKAQKYKKSLVKYKRICISCVICLLINLMLMVAIPTKKDMAIIYIIPKIANNEKIQNETIDIYNMAKSALREYSGIESVEKKNNGNN